MKEPDKKSKEPEKKPRRRIKKVRGHGGHHGGAWKVAYADFVTAMMALFLVLWLVSQADTKLKQAIASYFRSPGVFTTMQGGILGGPKKVSKEPSGLTAKEDEQALFGAAAMLQQKFTSRPEFSNYKNQIKVDVTDEGLRIQIVDEADRVSFNSGSADLTPATRAILKEVAASICQLPNQIRIGGHTDRHLFAPGSTYTNWELSADRANAARRALEAECVKPEQIQRIVGYADTQPLVPEDPYATANRRISIIVARMSESGPKTAAATESGDAGSKQTVSATDKPVTDKPATDKPATDKPATHTESAPDAQQHDAAPAGKGKMNTSGAVTVGEPDKLPEGAQKIKEPAAKKADN